MIWESRYELDFSPYICTSKLTDLGLKEILKMCGSRIQKLDMTGCNSLTAESFCEVAKLTNLTNLSISRCRMLPVYSFPSMTSLVKLKFLSMSELYSMSPESLQFLTTLTQLKFLDLSYNSLKNFKEHSKKLEKLKSGWS